MLNSRFRCDTNRMPYHFRVLALTYPYHANHHRFFLLLLLRILLLLRAEVVDFCIVVNVEMCRRRDLFKYE